MKIGVYLGDIVPTGGGGFTFQDDIFHALLACSGQTHHGFVLCGGFSRQEAKRLRSLDYEVVQTKRVRWLKATRFAGMVFRGLMLLWRAAGLESRFSRSLRSKKVDVVWFATPTAFEAVDLPYVYTVWDLQHLLQPWFPEVSARGAWAFREASYSEIIRRAAVVITGSEVGRSELARFYQLPEERVILLPHPTPSFALKPHVVPVPDIATKFGVRAPFVFYPAQFWPHKNHANLLLALRHVREAHGLGISLVLVGSDKGNKAHIQALAERLRVAQYVHFLGFVSREDLMVLYREALCLVYVSFFGPENLPPLEAFALGCPVVASNVAGADEQFGEAAFLVDPTNPEDIARAIDLICKDSDLRQKLVTRGLARAAQWTATDYVQRLLQFFDKFESIRRCWPAGEA